jgi:hypothetical protein
VALILACGLGACASNPAPSGWLRPPTETQRSALGAFVVVDTEHGRADGELIAVTMTHLILRQETGLSAIPHPDVKSATVVAYRTQESLLTLWGVLGTLSTASHGFFLVFSGPAWILATSLSAAFESRAALLTATAPFTSLIPYARFPQGLPEGLAASDVIPVWPASPAESPAAK